MPEEWITTLEVAASLLIIFALIGGVLLLFI